MDPSDLKGASTYVNNLLQARGLLRGDPIDFARPTRDNKTPARILNLVHELVTRRDRDADQREALGLTIKTLRTTETKQNDTIENLRTKIADLQRQNSTFTSQARVHTSSVRTLESNIRILRSENERLKSSLSQVRTQHATDLRKRDIQLQKMKERVAEAGRRGARGTDGPRIVIHPLPPAIAGPSFSNSTSSNRKSDDGRSGTPSLSEDTTDFLTTLSQNLADENDNLLALLRQCLSTLRAVQGLPETDASEQEPSDLADDHDPANPVLIASHTFTTLSASLDSALESLQEMLHQPNYVPIDELAARDEEIADLQTELQQLISRNETLQTEWKKAIELVDTWNERLKVMGEEAVAGLDLPSLHDVELELPQDISRDEIPEGVLAELEGGSVRRNKRTAEDAGAESVKSHKRLRRSSRTVSSTVKAKVERSWIEKVALNDQSLVSEEVVGDESVGSMGKAERSRVEKVPLNDQSLIDEEAVGEVSVGNSGKTERSWVKKVPLNDQSLVDEEAVGEESVDAAVEESASRNQQTDETQEGDETLEDTFEVLMESRPARRRSMRNQPKQPSRMSSTKSKPPPTPPSAVPSTQKRRRKSTRKSIASRT